ncbi:hypothetical protein BCV70DRAFT_98824 [Testicularia cyperi]|uniref:Uncharacterized protein n=1 Tax=Testicularia cyperi TaxID=1882483 RepID=A0A317XRC3_9BASI|nr:hypothetical protein BCV70DRAFT_98824 [Testicularia cyperi]
MSCSSCGSVLGQYRHRFLDLSECSSRISPKPHGSAARHLGFSSAVPATIFLLHLRSLPNHSTSGARLHSLAPSNLHLGIICCHLLLYVARIRTRTCTS